MTRRGFLLGVPACSPGAAPPVIRLHIGNYGLQTLPVETAIAHIRRIGYDGAELCLMSGWPSEPKQLAPDARRRIRESRFPIPTLIDSYDLLVSGEQHRVTLDRIHVAAQLAHDLNSKSPPLIQSVLGGRPGQWPEVRDTMALRLEDWGRAAAQSRVRLAVKAHANQAVDTPDKLLWLLGKVGSPALTAIYDYGHFQLRNLSIEATMEELLPRSAFLTVKDSRMQDGRVLFVLPGDGTIDYVRYFDTVKRMKWRGWVLVEISRQLQIQPGYDGVHAAERSYAHLVPILQAAGLR